jgi:hypothetical protein
MLEYYCLVIVQELENDWFLDVDNIFLWPMHYDHQIPRSFIQNESLIRHNLSINGYWFIVQQLKQKNKFTDFSPPIRLRSLGCLFRFLFT